MTQPISVVMPVYDGITQLDFTGPHQFLSRTPDLSVRVASLGGEAVTADRLTFSNLEDLTVIKSCDVLLVPGGGGCINAIENDRFIKEIARLGATARYLTSVCTGSLILGAAGLITGRRAACHWAWRKFLPVFGAVVDESRIVRDGNILSGGGVTAGIDFVLALIAELRGSRTAEMVQLGLEYAPEPPFNSGRPDTAPAEVLEAVNARAATLNDVCVSTPGPLPKASVSTPEVCQSMHTDRTSSFDGRVSLHGWPPAAAMQTPFREGGQTKPVL